MGVNHEQNTKPYSYIYSGLFTYLYVTAFYRRANSAGYYRFQRGLIMYDLKSLCIDILAIIAIACLGTVLMAATIKFIITYLF